jgi:hypothetical protein
VERGAAKCIRAVHLSALCQQLAHAVNVVSVCGQDELLGLHWGTGQRRLTHPTTTLGRTALRPHSVSAAEHVDAVKAFC